MANKTTKRKATNLVTSDLLLANRFGLVFKVQRWGKENQFNFPLSHAYIQLLCILLLQHNTLWDTNHKSSCCN